MLQYTVCLAFLVCPSGGAVDGGGWWSVCLITGFGARRLVARFAGRRVARARHDDWRVLLVLCIK